MAGRKGDEPEAPPPAEAGPPPGSALASWLTRIQENATWAVQEARTLWARRNEQQHEGDDPATTGSASDATVAMPAVGGRAARRGAASQEAAGPAAAGAVASTFGWLSTENGLAAAWADPSRRPWL